MIYKTKVFQAAFKKTGIGDKDLINACDEMLAGLVDADLGDDLYKKRIAMPGQGKRSGYRTMIGALIGERYFFLYIFSKSDKSNVNKRELKAIKSLSKTYLTFNNHTVDELVATGELIRVAKEKEDG